MADVDIIVPDDMPEGHPLVDLIKRHGERVVL